MTNTATAIRRVLPNGEANTATLKRVARVYGILQWENANDRGNVPKALGVRNTRERLPVPDGWIGVA